LSVAWYYFPHPHSQRNS